MPLIASENYTAKRIYLSADSLGVTILPINLYLEHRQRRRLNTNGERKFKPMVGAFGNDQIGANKFTPRFTNLANGVRIVPYDATQVLTIRGSLVSTSESLEGRDLFDRSTVLSNVDVDYQPPQVEIITVNAGGGGGNGASAAEIWSYPQRTLTGTQATNLAAIPNIPTNPLLSSAYTPPPSAATIADAVWDETLSQHLGVGSTGAKLSLASTLTVGDIPAGLTAAQVWTYTGGDRSLTGPQAVNLAATLGIVQAFAQGKFVIDYDASTATQYNTDGTVLQVFDLQDKDGNPATSAQTAVKRVPQQ